MSEWSAAEYAGRALADVYPGPRPASAASPHASLGADLECQPCACGGYIWARRERPGPSVEGHNATDQHRRWWARVERDWQGER